MSEQSDLCFNILKQNREIFPTDNPQQMIFLIKSNLYATNIHFVEEYLEEDQIFPFCITSDSIVGFVKYDGTVIPILDINKLVEVEDESDKKILDKKKSVQLEFDCFNLHRKVVILNFKDIKFGILVDRIMDNWDINFELCPEAKNLKQIDISLQYIQNSIMFQNEYIFILNLETLSSHYSSENSIWNNL
jgi:chemotaxis signal transduction protein